MGGCLSFSKKYNELHKQIDKPVIECDNECDNVNSDINKTPSIKFIENYIGNEYSISKSIETSNRLDNLIEYLENNVNSPSIYGRCDNDSEISGNNSSIDEITVKSHTFIITRSDSDIDKIDRRYTL